MFNTAPENLLRIQKWFAAAITEPLTIDHCLPMASSALEEAKNYIRPSKTLLSHERIELYYRQYWWRLLDVLQENFPTVVRLFGKEDFNQKIAIPYLSKHPSTHWALCRLGDTITAWIKRNYKENDREIIRIAAEMDWSAQIAFWSGKRAPIDPTSLSATEIQELLQKKIYLQPYISLFAYPCDFFSFRDAFLKEEISYWNSHPFPELIEKKSFFVVFRNFTNQVIWQEISESEHLILSQIAKGKTLSIALNALKRKAELLEEAMTLLPLWFQSWTSLGWFTLCGADAPD